MTVNDVRNRIQKILLMELDEDYEGARLCEYNLWEAVLTAIVTGDVDCESRAELAEEGLKSRVVIFDRHPRPTECMNETAFGKYFAGIFMDILNDAAQVYEGHIPEKQESWMTCELDQLWTPWLVEMGEVLSLLGGRYNPEKVRRELLDVVNQTLMLIKRLEDAE